MQTILYYIQKILNSSRKSDLIILIYIYLLETFSFYSISTLSNNFFN